jgi:hypothetical protein
MAADGFFLCLIVDNIPEGGAKYIWEPLTVKGRETKSPDKKNPA